MKPEPASVERSAPARQTVVFRLGDGLYGLDMGVVSTIARASEAVVSSSDYGLVRLRGKTVPLVDLGSRLDIPERPPSESSRIVVVDTQSGSVGFVVDEVTEVASLAGAEFNAQGLVQGTADRRGRKVALLSVDLALFA